MLSEPGMITFEKRDYLVRKGCGEVDINVLRQNGAGKSGLFVFLYKSILFKFKLNLSPLLAREISIFWRTIDNSGQQGLQE